MNLKQLLPPIHTRPELKTPDEHLLFLKEFARVQLIFLLHKWTQSVKKEQPMSLTQLAQQHTLLVNCTSFHEGTIFDPPGCSNPSWWNSYLEEIETYWEYLKPELMDLPELSQHALTATEEAISLLERENLFAPRVDRDLYDLHHGNLLRDFEQTCMVPRKLVELSGSNSLGDSSPSGKWLYFEIANAAYPHSFFDNSELLHQSFQVLIHQALEQGAQGITTTTWLNSLPKWVSLFPGCWRENMGQADPEAAPHLGVWGQFISSRQGFNRRSASHFLKTGRLPYPMRTSWCTLDELKS